MLETTTTIKSKEGTKNDSGQLNNRQHRATLTDDDPVPPSPLDGLLDTEFDDDLMIFLNATYVDDDEVEEEEDVVPFDDKTFTIDDDYLMTSLEPKSVADSDEYREKLRKIKRRKTIRRCIQGVCATLFWIALCCYCYKRN